MEGINYMKKVLAIVIALAMVLSLGVSLFADGGQTIYLKGSGNNFKVDGWNNIFVIGDAEEADDPNVWHIVYTGNNPGAITYMQLEFTNEFVFVWDPSLGFSTNGGGNNPGWVIVAPYDWILAYVNSGNNNESNCYVVTDEGGNLNFNISGYHKGSGGENGGFSGGQSLEFYKDIIVGDDADEPQSAGMFSFNIFKIGEDGVEVKVNNEALLNGYDYNGDEVSEIAPGTIRYYFGFAEGATEAISLANRDELLGDYVIREGPKDGWKDLTENLYFSIVELGNSIDFVYEDDVLVYKNTELGKLNVTADILQSYYKEYHKAIYQTGPKGSIVSFIDADGRAENKQGALGYAWGNNHTFVTIDIEAAREEALVFEMTIANPANEKIGLKYYVSVVPETITKTEKVKGVETTTTSDVEVLKITFDDDMLNGWFGADVFTVSDKPASLKNPASPKDAYYDNSDGNASFYAKQNANGGGKEAFIVGDNKTVYLYFKGPDGGKITYNNIIGCALDHRDWFTRDYEGDVTVVVENDGNIVYSGVIGETIELQAGDYAVTVTADGNSWSLPVTIVAGETVELDFGTQTIPGGENILECPFHCGEFKPLV